MAMQRTIHQSEAIASSIIDGVRVAIIGKPNAGKSSLLNRLARREVAITSPIPGTTRDLVEVACNIEGFKHKVVITDTAGMRNGADVDAVEQEGIKRAKLAANRADVVILVADLTDVVDKCLRTSSTSKKLLQSQVLKLWEEVSLLETEERCRVKRITVLNKLRL